MNRYNRIGRGRKMALFKRQRLGIDLGTVNTVIYLEGKGIVLREPTILAIDNETKEIKAYGKEAYELIGKTSDKIDFVYPIQSGVIHHFTYAKKLIDHFIRKASIGRFGRSEVIVCAPSNISKVERQSFVEVVKDLGIYRAMIIDEPFAAAIGSDIDVLEPVGRLLVDIGGGSTDIVLISYGEIINKVTLNFGGRYFDQLIALHVRQNLKMVISEHTAEEIKTTIGNAMYGKDDLNQTMPVSGKDLATRNPIEKEVSEALVAEALNEAINKLINGIRELLSVIPPELSADILTQGIYLSGGGSLLKRLPDRITSEIHLPVNLVNTPMDAVAVGAGKLFNQLHKYSQRVERNNR